MIRDIIKAAWMQLQRPAVAPAALPPPQVAELDTGATSFADYATRWLKRRETEGLLSGIDYGCTFRKHLFPAIGDMPLAEIAPRDIRMMVSELRSKPKARGAGTLAHRTVRNVYGLAHNIFATAVADEIIDRNPCCLRGNDLPKNLDANPDFKDQSIFTRGELAAIADVADTNPLGLSDYWRTLYRFLAFTGCRVGEATGLTWDRIDFDRKPLGCITLARSYSSKRDAVGETKTKAVRKVPVHPQLEPLLRAWYERRAGDIVFPAAPGRRRRSSVVLNRLHRDLAKLGLRPRRTHDFRRTLISLVNGVEGIDKDAIRRLTHSRPGDVYSSYLEIQWETTCREFSKWRI